MRWFRFAVFICLVAIVQAGLLAYLNIKPDLLLILLVFFAIYCNTTEAIITSFAIGFAADIIGSSMGPQMLSFGLFGIALAYLHRVVAIRKMPYQALAILITGFLTGTLAHLLVLLIKRDPLPENVFIAILLTSLYSGIVGPLLFPPAAWSVGIEMNRFQRRRSRR